MSDSAPTSIGGVNVNLGDISKPADTLIQKIGDAFGWYFTPDQIVRTAKAKADAAIIEANNQVEIQDIQRRAMRRFVEEEGRRQQCMEEITSGALPLLLDDAKPEKIENDWVTNFFDKARLISDEDMQKLWSKLLAGEANNPGSHSKKTVNILAEIEKDDAESFSSLCRYSCSFSSLAPIVFDTEHEIYRDNGINYSTIAHLETIGLLTYSGAGFSRGKVLKNIDVGYCGRNLRLTFPKDQDNKLLVGQVMLSKAGQDLLCLCDEYEVPGFFEYLQAQWKALDPKVLP